MLEDWEKNWKCLQLYCYWQQEAQQETKDKLSWNRCGHTSRHYMFNVL